MLNFVKNMVLLVDILWLYLKFQNNYVVLDFVLAYGILINQQVCKWSVMAIGIIFYPSSKIR